MEFTFNVMWNFLFWETTFIQNTLSKLMEMREQDIET